MIQQLMQQTDQSNRMYQQMLQQEQQNAQTLDQLAQRERQAVQNLQIALQGHQVAMQKMNQCLNICNQLEQAVSTTLGSIASSQSYMSNPNQYSSNYSNSQY
jgi:hypothetical protein